MGQHLQFFPEDRRRHTRVPLDIPVSYRPNGDARRGRAFNLSAGGLGLRPEAAIGSNVAVVVEFCLPPRTETCWAAGRIRWQQGAEDHTCGIEFSAVPEETRRQVLIYIVKLLETAVGDAEAASPREDEEHGPGRISD